jgi:hypothetical protein
MKWKGYEVDAQEKGMERGVKLRTKKLRGSYA